MTMFIAIVKPEIRCGVRFGVTDSGMSKKVNQDSICIILLIMSVSSS